MAYFRWKLKPAARAYCATEQEGLAVVAAIQHIAVYLYGVHFTGDGPQALSLLNTAKHQNGCLARWALQLQIFHFDIKYRPDSQNANADNLFRLIRDDTPLPEDHS